MPELAPLAENHGRNAHFQGLASKVGQQALAHELTVDTLPSLPEGYRYADQQSMQPAEVVDLFRKVEMGKALDDDYMEERQGMLDQISAEAIDLGVRDSNDQLVGFASIVHKGRSGELTDFVVSPDHQGKGIGRALVDSRLAIAEAASIDSLFISNPEPTNNLRTYYHDQGFQEDAYGDMSRGPEPVSFGALVAIQQPAPAI